MLCFSTPLYLSRSIAHQSPDLNTFPRWKAFRPRQCDRSMSTSPSRNIFLRVEMLQHHHFVGRHITTIIPSMLLLASEFEEGRNIPRPYQITIIRIGDASRIGESKWVSMDWFDRPPDPQYLPAAGCADHLSCSGCYAS